MRLPIFLLAATLLTASCATQPKPDAPSQLKAGLWEDSTSLNGAITTTMQKCIAEKAPLASAMPAPPTTIPKECSQDNQTTPSSFRGKLTCSNGKQFRMSVDISDPEHLSGSMIWSGGGGHALTLSLISHWVAPCPSDMQDGQIKIVHPVSDSRASKP